MDSDAGRNADALRELEQAAKLQGNDVNVHWRLAKLYRALGRKVEAKAEFEKASKLNKAADEELYKKMENGRQKGPPPGNADSAAPPQP
jgi:tetratricopeptide (TPR) repeat protein